MVVLCDNGWNTTDANKTEGSFVFAKNEKTACVPRLSPLELEIIPPTVLLGSVHTIARRGWLDLVSCCLPPPQTKKKIVQHLSY